MRMNQLNDALDYLKRSLAIDKQISLGVDSDPSISVTLLDIGRCLMQMNQLTEALNYLKRSLAIYERILLCVDSFFECLYLHLAHNRYSDKIFLGFSML